MMDGPDGANDIVVVCDPDGPAAAAVRAHLAASGLGQVTWIQPQDADGVDRAVADGQLQRVIWPDLPAWLTALWDGTLVPAHWRRSGLTIEFVDSPATPAATARALAAAWERWRRRQRLRQAVAGAALSAVALVAAFVVLFVFR